MSDTHVVVVGAGVVGASTADFLSRSGARVTIMTGRQRLSATEVSGGLVRAYEPDAVMRGLAIDSTLRWRRAGGRPGMRRTGSLVLLGPEDVASAMSALPELQSAAPSADVLDAVEVARRWPALRLDGVVAAVWEPEGGWASPPAMAAAAIAAAVSAGATQRNEDVLEVVSSPTGIVVRCPARDVRADSVVLAPGSYVDLLPVDICREVRTRRIRYSLVEWRGGALPALVDLTTGMWGRTHPNGQLLIGRPVDDWAVPPGFSRGADPAAFAHARTVALHRLPALKNARLVGGAWGTDLYRAAGPLLGESIDRPGIVLAAAWSGGGFKTSLAAGAKAADFALTAAARNVGRSRLGGARLNGGAVEH